MTLIKCYGEVFPNDIFIRLVSYLLTTTVNAINYFYQKYLNYADIRYYTLQSIKSVTMAAIIMIYHTTGLLYAMY